MEIECKIMDMTIDEFINLGTKAGLEPRPRPVSYITDEYWRIPSRENLIRFRRNTSVHGYNTHMDLTIKGSEENESNCTSERSETILSLDSEKDPSMVYNFLSELGGMHCKTVRKERRILATNDKSLRIHHDIVFVNYLIKVEWVEIESDTRDGLHSIIFKLLGSGKEAQDRVTNITTLDIMNRSGVGNNSDS